MSGGVDSSVAAYLMREAGYEVTGATMRLFDNGDIGIGSDKTCCSLESIEDACAVANKLGVFFLVYDMRDEFRKEVIGDFIEAYENGRTPNPCVVCNKKLKFEELYRLSASDLLADDEAKNGETSGAGRAEADADADAEALVIATGHYAIIEYDEASGRYKLRKAKNLEKDQSYVLYNLTQEQLARTAFPLGSLSKAEVRAIAEEQGFSNAQKKESQDICFVPDGDYAGFIRQYTGREYPPGDFVDEEGNVMGEHKGIIKYTIGQRKGLGLALKKPAYVLELDTENNRVILGDNEELFKRELEAEDFNWVSMAPPSGSFRASARIRYKHKEAPCEVIPLGEDSNGSASAQGAVVDNKTAAGAAADSRGSACTRVKIIFDEPQRAITRGQSVVLYDGDYVLGGGIII